MKRLIAMLAASILLVGAIAWGDARNGTRTDGLYYQASGIHPDAQLMKVNGDVIEAEEYFYWLTSVCDYLFSYAGGQLDFNAPLTEEMTYGQYAKNDAAETVKLYAVVRQWAEKEGITLSQEDLDALDTQRQQYVDYYGGEEGYLQQLYLLGVSESCMRRIEEAPLLYNRIYEQYCLEQGSLYPGSEAVKAYAEENGYVTAYLLYFPTAGLEQDDLAALMSKAEDFAQQLRQAEDQAAVYEQLALQLGLDPSGGALTFDPASSDPDVCRAIGQLPVGEVSGVIEGANGYYVALRQEANLPVVASQMLQLHLDELLAEAAVTYQQRLYDQIDAGDFYQRLNEERVAIMQAANAAS